MFAPFSNARRVARFAWYRSGLFWRTFLLMSALTAASMGSWIGMISVFQRGAEVQKTAELVNSVVTITKAALTHSAPHLRTELLLELVSNEGIRIQAVNDTDIVEPPPSNPLMPEIAAMVRERLGKQTRFSRGVNGVPGFYISFNIDEDEYWLMLERERIAGLTRVQWLGWATLVGLLSLLGAALISSLVNLPLARLTAAARAIAKGEKPVPLPEKGSQEIIEANRSFNQMVDDLAQVEKDRAVILAGISHDLRTPLARMQLEVEMAHLPQDAREGMQSDINQMDAIIGQFLDFAKPTDASTFISVNLSELLSDLGREAGRIRDLTVQVDLMPGVHVMGNATDLRRVVNNIIENARKYGKTPGQDVTEIAIVLRVKATGHGRRAVIEICDHGVGVPDDQIAQLLKPFTRLDSARGQANGAGLGLAIVERVLARHNAELTVSNREGGGLLLQLALPLAG
ncbi:sensor histidine kinase [Massilia yuzhufengensis]|uniref:histidine kinase n=1 Tax=Massilia yuzhufengensis TaxID=1164594 RepID=A0A1I1GMI7_9BURK|nr:sensor histidine kinase [Massilia yuzhufengensis]SFC12967.1 two-component system, OmpR family, osmolarity sensor histidine kinase EnvZ [Massilia yuzhufengensis]